MGNESLTLHFCFKDLLQRHINVTDPSKTNTFYNIECHLRSPQLIIHPAHSPKSELGRVTFHMARRIDIVLHNMPITININCGWNNRNFSYTSPAFGGSEITWQTTTAFAAGDIVCLDQNQLPLAKFHQACGIKKAGSLEFVEGRGISKEGMEEIVVIGLAVAQYRLYQSNTLVSVS